MKPIIFNTEEVQAILSGRKTMTRRVISFPDGMTGRLPESGAKDYIYYPGGIKRPQNQPGDILWVRETWCEYPKRSGLYRYKANEGDVFQVQTGDDTFYIIPWCPSIHMPREAARIFLLVTDVRVERLQEISAVDALREGVTQHLRAQFGCSGGLESEEDFNFNYAVDTFRMLWNNLYAKRCHGWDTNPWVWVIEFERFIPGEGVFD